MSDQNNPPPALLALWQARLNPPPAALACCAEGNHTWSPWSCWSAPGRCGAPEDTRGQARLCWVCSKGEVQAGGH